MKHLTALIATISLAFLLKANTYREIPWHNSSSLVTSSEDSVKSVELFLAREFCPHDPYFYSFCEQGFHHPIRFNPAFVKLNKDDFLESYEDTVYRYPTYLGGVMLIEKDIPHQPYHVLDSMFRDKEDIENVVSYRLPRWFKRRIKKGIERYRLSILVPDHFGYALYKIKLKCVYGGKHRIAVPGLAKGEENLIDKYSETYFITEIEEVTPVLPED